MALQQNTEDYSTPHPVHVQKNSTVRSESYHVEAVRTIVRADALADLLARNQA